MQVLGINPKMASFGRAPSSTEAPVMESDINEAKKFLGIKDQSIILHGSCFPVSDKDLFIGSPINEKAKEVNKFFKMFGFDSIQQGPSGKLFAQGEHASYSPYSSSATSENYLFSDMSALTKKEYGKLLDASDIDAEIDADYIKQSDKTDFNKAFKAYDKLFDKAYTNLFSNANPEAANLKKEFTDFKVKRGQNLYSDAVYDVLEKKLKCGDVTTWPEEYQTLMLDKANEDSPLHKSACEKLNKIEQENSKQLDLYKFKQFIIDKQKKAFLKDNPEKLNYIADNTIGMSYQSVFAHPDAFLKDFRIGCPRGGEGSPLWNTDRGANQFWDIPVLNPKRLFKKDGSLDVAGQLLHDKLATLLETYQNVRIDHALGLVDPWVYKRSTVEIKHEDAQNPRKVTYSGAVGTNISQMGKTNVYGINDGMAQGQKETLGKINADIAGLSKVDPNGDYPKILEKIVLPLLKEKGLSPNDLVWEDLGSGSAQFDQIYHDKLHIPGITNIRWQRGQGQNPENYYLITSHDDDTFTHLATNEFFQNNKNGSANPDFLIGWLYPDKSSAEQAKLKEGLSWDTKLRVKTMYQELFRCSKKMQMSFMDFFGLDKQYNASGTCNEDNWTLRLTKDYQKKFYDALEKQDWKTHPLNIPEMYERAVISKAYTENYANEADKNKAIAYAKSIANKMAHWKDVLYEKTVDVVADETTSNTGKKTIDAVEKAIGKFHFGRVAAIVAGISAIPMAVAFGVRPTNKKFVA
jgi:4-alpha-glucanotransferase